MAKGRKKRKGEKAIDATISDAETTVDVPQRLNGKRRMEPLDVGAFEIECDCESVGLVFQMPDGRFERKGYCDKSFTCNWMHNMMPSDSMGACSGHYTPEHKLTLRQAKKQEVKNE
jgi:hypothetical protein